MNENVIRIDVGGIVLLEPMTFFTNVLVFTLCLTLASKLEGSEAQKFEIKSWKTFFRSMGWSSLLGGFSHLLFFYGGMKLKLVSWVFAGSNALFFQLAASVTAQHFKFGKYLRIVAVIQSIAFILLLFNDPSFLIVKNNITLGFLMVASTLFFMYFKDKIKYNGLNIVGLGIISGAMGGVVSKYKISLHAWFTYHDLGHLCVMLSMSLVFLGIAKYFKQAQENAKQLA